MLDLWDNFGRTLNGLISDHENNTVGHATTHMYASGGPVLDAPVDLTVGSEKVSNTDANYPSLSQELAMERKQRNIGSTSDFNIFGGRETNYYNSPEGITNRIMNGWHNFFQGERANPGGTNAPMQKPQKNKALESENPNDFYARWYNRMRQFAQAEEVADRGQSQIKTR